MTFSARLLRCLAAVLASAVAGGCSESSRLVVPEPLILTTTTLLGEVRSPTGEPLADATVTVAERSATTNERGGFVLTVPTANSYTLAIAKTGYEVRAFGPMFLTSGVSYQFVLRKAFRLNAGENATLTLEAGDGLYDFPRFYTQCPAPCKLVQVVVPAPGTLSVSFAALAASPQFTVVSGDGSGENCCASPLHIPAQFYDPTEVRFYVSVAGALAGIDPRVHVTTTFVPR